MARPPFFIRELKRPPNEDGGFIFTPKKQSLRQIIKGGITSERELFAQNQTRITEKNRNENRILNLSNNLDSIRTYSWQAIFEFKGQTQEILAGDIPKLTAAIKNIEFPSFIKDKQFLSLDGASFGIILGFTNDKTFRITLQDLYAGNVSVFNYLLNNKYITSDTTSPQTFGLKVFKYTTDGELFEILAFTECKIFGYKLGTYDYHKNEMQEYLLEVSYESFLTAPPQYADKLIIDMIKEKRRPSEKQEEVIGINSPA
jgi:hypothetical protein